MEQVAELLGLHVRTVRAYIREGRLKAVRIGKQYRIGRADLEAFTGQPVADPEIVRRERHAEVSSVVQIDAISPGAASRVSNMVLAAVKTREQGDQPLRIDTMYDEERGRLKVIVTGSLGSSAELLKLIALLVEADA